jgi:adenine-specific DNA-methyltransferase
MEKLKLHSPDLTQVNIEKLAQLFPNCVAEARDADGTVKRNIDFDQLRQELSAHIVEGPQERYQLNWPGKLEALFTANAPIARTLRPCREESVDFDITENLFIEGDNLDALKLLQETYLNKVKLIYIDPPYNTGSDLIYEDDFSETSTSYYLKSNQLDAAGARMVANTEANGRFHSDWLSMIYPRLKLARNLLADDGFIFISIDDGEVHNLRKICDEILGNENFVADIIWQKKTSPDARMNISAAHDHIIVYSKVVDKSNFSYLPFDEERRKSFTNPDNDHRGEWASVDLTGQTGRAPKSQFYEIETPSGIKMPPPEGRCWALAQATFLDLVKDNRIWFGVDGKNRPRLKKFLSESEGTRPWTWWDNKSVGHNQEASQELKNLFNDQVIFDNPKPVRLIQRIVQLSTSATNNDIVLDFFAGSATTAQAVISQNMQDKGNRKFLLIQLPQPISPGSNDFKADSTAFKLGYTNISQISKERIRRAGEKIKRENSDKPSAAHLDIGFRVLKVDTSNMKEVFYTPDAVSQDLLSDQVNNIREDRTPEDLLFQVLLDWGVDLMLPITQESIAGKSVYFIDGNALAACFEEGVSEEFVKLLAKREPLRVVFRDAGFASDSVKINVEQIFKLMSPATDIKTI